MDMNGNTPLSPLESARAVLGEHYKNYVIIVQDYDEPTTYNITYSDPFVAKGLLDSANNYHQAYLSGGEQEEIEWLWTEEDEEETD